MSTTVEQDVSNFRASVQAFKDANPDALFMGSQTICCMNLQCGGITLISSVVSGKKNQKNFSGLMGEKFTRMDETDIAEWRATLKEIVGEELDGICECKAVK